MKKQDEVTELKAKVAALESKLDMLETEFCYLNQTLIDCGFSEGIVTLKQTVEEVISERLDLPSMNLKEDEDLI